MSSALTPAQDALVSELVNDHGRAAFSLDGRDGNAFSLMAAFRDAAKDSGWPRESINRFRNEVLMKGDYDHLLVAFMEVTDADEC
jgi:hypothetical protein